MIEQLENEEIDYFLITLRHEDSEKKADIFYRFKDDDSVEYINEALEEMEDEDLKCPSTAKAASKKLTKKPKDRKRRN